MSHAKQLRRDQCLILIVDLQSKLLTAIHDASSCVAASTRLLQAASILHLPVLATEQYPAGLGATIPDIRQLLGQTAPIAKMRFSACVPEIRHAIETSGRRQIVVAGIEAHVCVQQTVLELIRLGYDIWVCADALSSRRPYDCQIALERMRQASAAVTTVESAIFELLGEAGTDQFKQMLKIVK